MWPRGAEAVLQMRRRGAVDLQETWDYAVTFRGQLAVDSLLHVSAAIQCVLIATVLAVGIGVAVFRSTAASAVVTALASAILTVPSFALLGLLIPVLGLGVPPTVTALVLYALLPIVRNTVLGLSAVDPTVTDAARGIGMSRVSVLTRIELRLAWPSILTGIRVSTQLVVGILAIAAYVKGPGLGNLIFSGLSRIGSPTAVPQALTGTVLVVLLALILDAGYVLLGRVTTSRGIRA